MTPDPLLERLGKLPRPALDDVAAARTLARAEEAFAVPRAERLRRPLRATAWIPAALGLWGLLYVWGAVRELVRLFPAAARPTIGVSHWGSSVVARAEPEIQAKGQNERANP